METMELLVKRLAGIAWKREMVLYSSGTEHYIPFCDILYFESSDGKVYAHTARSVYTTDRKLFELEEALPPSFVRIAKSTIANVDLVSSLRREMVGNGEMYFKNSEKKVYFSRGYYKTLRDKIQEMRLR
jgi:DNA-binding LytR/AlgR family response regulator